MYRIVGCILLVAAGTGMGFSGSMKLSEKIYTLEMLLRMGIFLKGEIRCGNMSLPDAFYGVAGRMYGKYREFLVSAAAVFASLGRNTTKGCQDGQCGGQQIFLLVHLIIVFSIFLPFSLF